MSLDEGSIIVPGKLTNVSQASPLPVCRPDEIAAGAVALVGVPWDLHSSLYRGCADGPAAIRAALASGSMNLCTEDERDLVGDGLVVDVGDVAGIRAEDDAALADEASDAAALAAIEDSAAAVYGRGGRVLALGGDHAVSVPLVTQAAAAHPGLTLLHFDAHPDLYDQLDGDRMSHACPFARIMEAGLATRLIQVGIRTMTPHQRAQVERFGVEVITMKTWTPAWRPVLSGPLYVSIDLDAFDPAYAPGVSHYEPGGLSPRAVLDIVQELPVAPIGADVVELNPHHDHRDMTAMVALKLVVELAGRMLAS